MTDVLERIDETLTYYSAGLGEDVTVLVEAPDLGPELAFPAGPGVYRVRITFDPVVRAVRYLSITLDETASAMSGLRTARRDRLAAMHHAYRQRRRGRKR